MTSAFGRGRRRKQTNRCLRLQHFFPEASELLGSTSSVGRLKCGVCSSLGGTTPEYKCPSFAQRALPRNTVTSCDVRLPVVTVWPSRSQARLQVGYQSIDLVLVLALRGDAHSLRHWLIISHAMFSGIFQRVFLSVREKLHRRLRT